MSSFDISDEQKEKLKMYEDQVTKEFGDGHLEKANNLKRKTRISSGSLKVDRITGGGWKIGCLHGIWGPKGSGKTTACIQAMKWAQRMCHDCYEYITPKLIVPPEDADIEEWKDKRYHCMNCGAPYHEDQRPPKGKNNDTCKECGESVVVELDEDDSYDRIEGDYQCGCEDNDFSRFLILYVDFEGKLDLEWVEKIGVNLDGIRLERPDYGAQGADLTLDVIEQGIFDAIFWDSIATYITSERAEKSVEEDIVGTRAQEVGHVLQEFPSRVNQSRREHGVIPTMFVINQVRKDIGNHFGDDRTKPGGEAQEFMPSTWIKTRKAYTKSHQLTEGPGRSGDSKNGIAGGEGTFQSATKVHFRFKCEKNSTGPTTGTSVGPAMLVIDWKNRKAGDWCDHNLVYSQARKAGAIYKQDREWHIKDWPLVYDTAGDIKVDIRHRWYLKKHLQDMIHEREMNDFYNLVTENDWVDPDDDIKDL